MSIKVVMRDVAGELDEMKGTVATLVRDNESLREENRKLREDNATLRQSNVLLEDETERLRHMNRELSEDYEATMRYVSALEKRSFWDRLFNREV